MSYDRVPENVISALRYVRDEGPAELELYDRDDVLYVMHNCGFDDACDWVHDHEDLYFEAVRNVIPGAPLTGAPHESASVRA
ncbi:MAG TPA: hypothetical protein VJP07_10405 [Dehalococcoidia bacterium]|nr:hypothetical protein [Dehalococcoidia bacterium]